MKKYTRAEADAAVILALKKETGFTGIFNISDYLHQHGMDIGAVGFFILHLAIQFDITMPGASDRFPQTVGEVLELIWKNIPVHRRA